MLTLDDLIPRTVLMMVLLLGVAGGPLYFHSIADRE